MAISESHASHIRRVSISAVLSGHDLDPTVVTARLALTPRYMAKRGHEKYSVKGQPIGVHEEGFWRIDSTPAVNSKDINDHFRYLLGLLLPKRDIILELAARGETHFGVLWESTYLYAGTGPLIDAEAIQGMAHLEAGIGFDIYQINEDDSSEET